MSCDDRLRTGNVPGREDGFVLNPEGEDSKFLRKLSALARRLVTGTSKKDQLLSNNILDKNGHIRFTHPAVQNALYNIFADEVHKELVAMIKEAEEKREKNKKCKSCH